MPDTLRAFTDIYAAYGCWVLFFGVMLENAGVPIPGETALLAAGFLASPAGGGMLHLCPVIAVAAAGAVIGDNIGYWVGREFARKRIEAGQRFLFLTPRRVERAERYFDRYGAATVFFGRFVALLRIVAGPAAGVAGMAWWRFALANAAGAVVWATAIGLVGYYAGGAWDVLHRWLGRGAWALAGVIVLGAIAWHFLPYRMKGKSAQ